MAVTSVTCLINRGPSCFLLAVSGEHKLGDLRAAMRDHSSLQTVEDSTILQVHNKTFDVYVNIDENTVLKDNAVIRVLDVCVLAEGGTTDEVYISPGVSFTEAENFPSTSAASQPSTSTGSGDRSLRPFRLPDMPSDIEARVNDLRDGPVPDSLRLRIVSWLWYELSRYDLYPRERYRLAAEALVRRYPQLKDSTDNDHFTWQTSLRFKGKNSRKTLPKGITSVEIERKKAALRMEKSAARKKNVEEPSKFCSRKTAFWNGVFEEGEDEKTVEGHIDIIRRELKKAGASAEKIEESMKKTFKSRRALIENDRPTLVQLLDVYPALKVERELYNEFQRLTSVNVREGLNAAIQRYGDRILRLVMETRTKDNAIDITDDYGYTVAVLKSLPRLVKEQPAAILSQLVMLVSHIRKTK